MTSRSALGLSLIVVVVALGAVVGFQALTGDDSQVRDHATASYLAALPGEAVPSGSVFEVDIVAAPAVAEFSDDLSVEVWAYNGTVPGPELRVALGDTVVVNFENQLPQATSIHWHGIRVPNSMDGVPGVNQAPVEPGESFRYEFVPKDAGTFWFHSHNRGSEQIERGLYGSVVVVDPAEPTYDRDLVWMIDDVLLDGDVVVEDFNDAHETTHNGRWGNVVTLNGRVAPTIDVNPGERVRIRLVNASNARVIAPEFPGLDPIVIAVDGTLVRQPFSGQGFVMAPGNRVDLDITLPDAEQQIVVAEDFNGEGFDIATLNIRGSSADTPTFAAPVNDAIPRSDITSGLGIDHEYSLDYIPDSSGPKWGFNGRTFAETETLSVDAGELVTVRLSNGSQALHPIHLHGQFFQVTAIDGVAVDNGHLRDTVLVYPGENIDLAMAPVDVGTWAVHCHIQEHAEAGMMTLLEVDP